MSVTLDIPPHILEGASNYAASEGISLDALIARTLATVSNQAHSPEQELANISQKPIQKMGLMPDAVLYIANDVDAPLEPREIVVAAQRLGRLRGTVLYMADDFDAPLEDFKEYME
jgi:uncharacterized membrane protein YebE (DUF533 family)